MLQFIKRRLGIGRRPTLADREADVRRRLRPAVAEYEGLIALIYDYIIRAAEAYAANPHIQSPVANLQLVLLARLQGDLRVCSRSACDGYPIQALTIASSIHEVAYSIIYLGPSNERAKEWTEHTKTQKQYPECGHRNVIQSAKPYFPLTEAELKQEYDIYTQLCWAKHGNPILQREYGVVEVGEAAEVQQLPYYSDRTIKYGRYAMLHAARAVGAALVVFTQLHLRKVVDEALAAHLEAIGPELYRIGTRDGLMTPRL